MGKPKAPKQPDMVQAAKAQGEANVEAARASAKLSNPNVINPYGSQTVTYDGDIPTVTQTLSPEQKALFDQQNRISQGLGNVAEGQLGSVAGTLGTAYDPSKLPPQAVAGQQGWDNAYNAIMNRNQPQMGRQRSQLETQLSNQGLFRGSEGYTNAMRDQAMRENDFMLGAQREATAQQQAQFGMDTQARQNALSQDAFLRSMPLNELNALRSGSQVNVPQFQGYQGQNIQAAPISQGIQQNYQNALGNYGLQSSGQNSMMGGLFGLGAASLGAPAGTFPAIASALGLGGSAPGLGGLMALSDARLKHDAVRIGTTESGIPIYEFSYIGSSLRYTGVMAQDVEEVIPDAVITHSSGFKMVQYDKVQ